jgi:outer membrane receptor protein involved in Fe transport
MARADRRLRRGAVLSALMSAQTARFESPGAMALSSVDDGTRGFYDSRDPAGQGLSDRLLGRLGWQRDTHRTDAELFAYGMARRFSLTENFTGRLQYGEEGDRRTQAQQGGTAGISALVDHPFNCRIRLTWRSGAGWRMDAFHQKETQVDDADHPWQTNRRNRAVLHSLHAFTGLRISPWDKLALFPSIRLDTAFYDVADPRTDEHDNAVFAVPSPRMTIALPLHRAITLFADYGRGFRLPEARAILAPVPSSVEDSELSRYEGGAPEPSIADSVEAGAEVTPLSMLSVKVTGFGVWMEREMLFDHVSNMNIEQDGTTRLGLELEAAFAPLSWLRLEADATAVRARFRRSGHPVPGAPTAMGNARFRAGEDKGPHGSAEVFWMGRRHLAHGASVQGYGVLNLDAGWRFERYDITAVLDNALNAKVMEGAYHFASHFGNGPRSVIPEIQYVAGPPLTLRVVFTLYL